MQRNNSKLSRNLSTRFILKSIIYNLNSAPKGFTIVEILIVAPIVILVIGTFITAIVGMTGDVLVSRAANKLTYDVADALDRIETDIKNSGGTLNENGFVPVTPQGKENNTTKFSSSDGLVINSYATTKNPMNSDSGIVFKSTSGCVAPTEPLMYNTVYFVANDTLWRRVIMPENYGTTTCDIPWQLPSCELNQIGANCISKDEKLITGIKTDEFDIEYFDISGATTTAPADAVSATVTISATGTAAGRTFTESGSIRASISEKL